MLFLLWREGEQLKRDRQRKGRKAEGREQGRTEGRGWRMRGVKMEDQEGKMERGWEWDGWNTGGWNEDSKEERDWLDWAFTRVKDGGGGRWGRGGRKGSTPGQGSTYRGVGCGPCCGDAGTALKPAAAAWASNPWWRGTTWCHCTTDGCWHSTDTPAHWHTSVYTIQYYTIQYITIQYPLIVPRRRNSCDKYSHNTTTLVVTVQSCRKVACPHCIPHPPRSFSPHRFRV